MHENKNAFVGSTSSSAPILRIHFWLTRPEESKSILFGSSAVCRDKLPELRLSAPSSSAADRNFQRLQSRIVARHTNLHARGRELGNPFHRTRPWRRTASLVP